MREEAKHFLQFVPLKEPRTGKVEVRLFVLLSRSLQVLSVDKELDNFDSSKFIFTDITFDATDQVYSGSGP